MSKPCEQCGAELGEGQDWCLQCGTAAPGGLEPGGPGWRSATAVLGITAVLVLGAAAAAYAALSQPSPPKVAPKVITVAQAPTTASVPSTPGTATTPAPTPTTSTPGAGTPTTVKPLGGTTTPPKIPLTAPTPKSTGTTSTPTETTKSKTESGGSGTGKTKSSGEGSGKSGTSTEGPAPILLDTNAASTYNPYNFPASGFGDPSLAIDGETSTAWTAQVEPSVAPRMAVGLAIDLREPQRVGSITLITSTPGMTVQVYGTDATTLPTSITDPAWVTLSPSLDAKKRSTHVNLRHSAKAFRFVTLWISAAPKSAVGTPTAPGHVSVNELDLFPAK